MGGMIEAYADIDSYVSSLWLNAMRTKITKDNGRITKENMATPQRKQISQRAARRYGGDPKPRRFGSTLPLSFSPLTV